MLFPAKPPELHPTVGEKGKGKKCSVKTHQAPNNISPQQNKAPWKSLLRLGLPTHMKAAFFWANYTGCSEPPGRTRAAKADIKGFPSLKQTEQRQHSPQEISPRCLCQPPGLNIRGELVHKTPSKGSLGKREGSCFLFARPVPSRRRRGRVVWSLHNQPWAQQSFLGLPSKGKINYGASAS